MEAADFVETFSAMLRAVRGLVNQAYAETEVGTAQAKLLRHIGKTKISQAALARATDTAPTLTGRALEPLIERGWVRRKRSDEDRREYLVELTAAGQRARDRVLAAREGVGQRMLEVLDARDVADLERIAKKLVAAFGG